MSSLSAKFYDVRLELARQRDRPNGDSGHGYHLIVPLTRDGHLDVSAWQANPTACRVRRFRPTEEHVVGHLARRPPAGWCFDYGPRGNVEEPGYRFGDECFVPGEYVSIREKDGKYYVFKVASVRSI